MSWRGQGRPSSIVGYCTGVYSPECDVNEKVLSDPRDPRFGDEATRFECSEFIAQTVDDEVEDFWWKGARHLRCVFGVDYRC